MQFLGAPLTRVEILSKVRHSATAQGTPIYARLPLVQKRAGWSIFIENYHSGSYSGVVRLGPDPRGGR